MPPSTESICNHLRAARLYGRKFQKKYDFSIPIDSYKGDVIRDVIRIDINIKTGNVGVCGYLYYKRNHIWPGTHKFFKKRNCNDLEYIKKVEGYIKTNRSNISYKSISDPIDSYKGNTISSVLRVRVNKNTGRCWLTHRLWYKSKYVYLPKISEEKPLF